MTKIPADITGTVWKLEAVVGQNVQEGDTLLIVESMKMEIPVSAPRAGVVRELLVAEGELVQEDQIVVLLD